MRRTLWAALVGYALLAAAGLVLAQSASVVGPSGNGERGPGRGGGPAPGGVGWSSAPASLRDGLVAYWTLDEVSGTRFDSIGGNHLDDINTVGSDVGVIGNGALFVAANSERLEDLTPSVTPGTGPFTVSAWVKAGAGITGAGTWGVFCGGETTGWFNTGGTFYNSNSGTAVTLVGCGSPTLYQFTLAGGGPLKFPADTNWHHAVFWWNGAGLVGFTWDGLNDGIVGGLAQTYQGFTPPSVTCSKAPFTAYGLGVVRVNVGTPSGYWDGMIDEVGVWNRQLTRAEIATLASGVRP